MNEPATTLEICVDDLTGVRAAVAGGADRLELCSALALGGLTPSAAFAATVVKGGVSVHAMVRPRAGDFNYDDDEIALIENDIARLAELGVSGVVVGAADTGGKLNERALARFRETAKDIAIVLHRAIDLAPDPVAAVRIAASLGYDYVLTSRGATSAIDGRLTIERMVTETRGALTIIAGAGVTPENAAMLVRETGVRQIHASASRPREWVDGRIEDFGFASGPRRVTEATLVAALKQAISHD